jgi:hypothetical protein
VRSDKLDERLSPLKIECDDCSVVVAPDVKDDAFRIEDPGRRISVEDILHLRPRRTSERSVQFANCLIRIGVRFAERQQGAAIEHVHVDMSSACPEFTVAPGDRTLPDLL